MSSDKGYPVNNVTQPEKKIATNINKYPRHDLAAYLLTQSSNLILSSIMLKNGQTYSKNLAVFTPQDF